MNAPTPDQIKLELSRLERVRQEVIAEMETLRTRESNLRAYEDRLRAQPAVPATPLSRDPWAAPPQLPLHLPGSSRELAAEWEKFHRSRALLEAERRALTDERLALREERTQLQKQTAELGQRQRELESRERETKVQSFAPPPRGPSLTQAPFVAAKKLFRGAS